MEQSLSPEFWSATPTPLDERLRVDEKSVHRTIVTGIAEGISGFFVAGTCGEGPWLPNAERKRLVAAVVAAADGKAEVAAQVTDNSVPRILDNIREMADLGVDFVLIAAPPTMMNATPDRIEAMYVEAVSQSPLPVGIYDWGKARPNFIPNARLAAVYSLPNVALIKDSSADPVRRAIALTAKKTKPGLRLFNGNEFRCIEYIEAGYDGCMFGGAAAIAPLLRRIRSLLRERKPNEARAVEEKMKSILFGIYGGETIPCWLTGLKYYMMRRKLFAGAFSYLGYPLHDECRAFIDRYVEAPFGSDSEVARSLAAVAGS